MVLTLTSPASPRCPIEIKMVYSTPASPIWRAWPSRMVSCRAMKAKMLCTSLRKSRSVPSFRSSGRVTVSGKPPRELRDSVRRGVWLRSALAFWRATCVLRKCSQSAGINAKVSCGGSSDHRQNFDIVGMLQRAIKYGIAELDLEAACGADAADRRQRAAEHDRA